MTEPTLDAFPVRTAEKLRFADTDQHGHVTNAVFAVCFQNARLEVLRERDLPPADGLVILARLDIAFLSELHWPGDVTVGTRAERIGRASLQLGQAIFSSGRCCAVATSTCVLVDRASRRSMPWPEHTIAALGALMPAQSAVELEERAASLPHQGVLAR
jgi:acyl-CoA thioester hydrolase